MLNGERRERLSRTVDGGVTAYGLPRLVLFAFAASGFRSLDRVRASEHWRWYNLLSGTTLISRERNTHITIMLTQHMLLVKVG